MNEFKYFLFYLFVELLFVVLIFIVILIENKLLGNKFVNLYCKSYCIRLDNILLKEIFWYW